MAEPMTVEQIEAQIADARERLAVLDREAQEFALPAVAGDQDAVSISALRAGSSPIWKSYRLASSRRWSARALAMISA